jgi:hypothetical protein
MENLSRSEVPEEFRRAKQAAAAQYLRPSQPAAVGAAFAISARPEHNVVGVGVGRKITDGKPTGEYAVRLYVERKLPRDVIPTGFLLPDTLSGLPTDVVETGRFRAQPAAVPLAQRKMRPARPGCSVGFQFSGSQAGFVMAGTLGAIVQANGTRYLLSNNHVLANENALPANSPIFQPGLLDNGSSATDQIARLTRFVQLRADQPNQVDCAIAEVLDPKLVRATFLARVGRLKSNAPIDAVEGMRVHKVGRTTGYTRGAVIDVSADVAVTYDLGNVTFQGQVLVQGDQGMFSDRGDSGSVIVDRDTQRPTALLFAGSSTHTIANHLADVLAQLGVSMVI